MTKALGHERNDTIDVFRAIAILSVMTYHYTCSGRITHIGLANPSVVQLGRFGVHLFFIVSGLVITMTITRSKSALDFAAKRFARIYPAFIVAAVTTFLFTKLIRIPQFWISGRQFLANISPYNFGQQSVDPSYWSLTYEIQFYLYVALAFVILRQRFWIGLLALTVVGAVAAAGHAQFADKYLMARYMPLFLIGVGTWIAVYERKRVGWAILATAVLCYFPAVPRFDDRAHSYSLWMLNLYILGLGGALVLMLALRIKVRGFLLATIGRASYSLYLIHQVIGLSIIATLKALGVPSLACVLSVAVLMIGLAWLMFHLVEEPGRKLLLTGVRRVETRWRRTVPAVASA